MKICLEPVGMRLLGGTSGNTGEGQPKKVACNGEVFTDAVAYAVIGSKMGRIEIVKENLFRERPITHRVTRASEDGRTVLEIDGRKAMDVYEEESGYTDTKMLVGQINGTMANVQARENKLLESFDSMNLLVDSNVENAKETQGAIANFNTIAHTVKEKTERTVQNVLQAQEKSGNIQTEIGYEMDMYDSLDETLFKLKKQLSRKSVLFEDINNILEQLPYICEQYNDRDMIAK